MSSGVDVVVVFTSLTHLTVLLLMFVSELLNPLALIEGSQPERCMSSMIYSRDTPFWSETVCEMTRNSELNPWSLRQIGICVYGRQYFCFLATYFAMFGSKNYIVVAMV